MAKKLPAKAGEVRDKDLIPGSERSSGEGNGYPLHYSCLKNSMDRGAWQATAHGVTKSRMQLSNFHFTSLHPLQYSCLKNSMDRGAWQAIVQGDTKSRTQLSDCHTQ